MYEDKTVESLHKKMLDDTPTDIDKRQGSITHDMTKPAAGRAAELYIDLENNLNLGFVDTAKDADNEEIDWLNKRTSELNVKRKPAVKATGQLTFTGPEGTVIGVGQRCSTNSSSPLYFVVLSEGTIPNTGTITLNAEAEEGGLKGNVGANTITEVLGNLSGTATVTNASSFEGGVDKESNEDLYNRYLDRLQRPATSGNGNHYLQWSKEVTGVGDSRVFPVWNGNGTVKVVIIDSERTGADLTLVNDVQTYIESVMPIGPTLTVESAAEVAINISATITLVSGATLSEAQIEIEASVKEYLKKLAFVDAVVRYNEIGKLILDCASVLDYSNMTINGATANVEVTNQQVAILGTVTLS